MRNKTFRLSPPIICATLLLASSYVSATLVTHNNYTLDTSTNIVSNNGMEWLQWTQTQGKSINEALSTYSQQGWTLAKNTQMTTLFADFGLNSNADENISSVSSSQYNGASDNTSYDQLLELFGITHTFEGVSGYGTGNEAWKRTSALFGSDKDKDGQYNSAFIRSDAKRITTPLGRPTNTNIYNNFASISVDQYSPDYTHGLYGIALTRTLAVPAPATLTIFALGLMGLGLRRRKNKMNLSG